MVLFETTDKIPERAAGASESEDTMPNHAAWPALRLADWQDTYATVHLWSQIVGKVRLARMPWFNHSWHVPLYVNARGLTTSLIPAAPLAFEIEFDFTEHQLHIRTTSGKSRAFPLEPMTVAAFYANLMRDLAELNLDVRIHPRPVELPDPIQPFPEDETHGSYDAEAVERFWRALVQIHRVFTEFRARFTGKVSPVHFFWGAFDLAVTRFSGRVAPKHPGGAPNCPDWVMEEAYSQEVSSAGFWPGAGFGEAAFYSYAYPEPDGFRAHPVRPVAARFAPEVGEFILPYEAVRTASDPDAMVLEFLQSTYEAAADLARWDRSHIERPTGHPSGRSGSTRGNAPPHHRPRS